MQCRNSKSTIILTVIETDTICSGNAPVTPDFLLRTLRHRQVGSHCRTPLLPLCQTPETCSCCVFFGLYLLGQTMFFSPREAQNILASEFSFLKLLSPVACVFNLQFHCYCTALLSMSSGGKCQVCT